MKCYVIKSKEGKYLSRFHNYDYRKIKGEQKQPSYTSEICNAMLFKDYEAPTLGRESGMEIVEVTIAEGDLEKQLEENDREIKLCCEKVIIDMNYIEMLELQLDKADKEIEEQRAQVEILKNKVFEKMETQLLGVTKDKIKEIRHQVCEEIREWCKNDWDWDDFMRFLDQIEKGK